MKLGIVGSRSINLAKARNILDETIKKDKVTTIISGGARGVDTVAKDFAIDNNIGLIEFLPDYKSYGRYAPIRRNTDIINNSDYILALWDGNSKGTQDSIKKAKNLNKIVKVIRL